MSLPRFIRPGCYWLVTRRTLNRMFLLLPEPWVAALFEYALARACQRTRVQVIGGCVMSTHYHLVVYDPFAELPLFAQHLDELVARAGNAQWERRDYYWESAGARYTELLAPVAIEEALVYCLTNPQEAGLVARSAAWQHWQSRPAALGTERVVNRPDLVFFTDRTTLPAELTLALHVPQTHAALGVEGWRALIERRLARRETKLHEERNGKPYLGMARVLAFSETDTPDRYEAPGETQPIAKVGQLEQAPEAHKAYRERVTLFRLGYRAAYEEMRRGRACVFPHGTYRWRIQAGQRCEPAPQAA